MSLVTTFLPFRYGTIACGVTADFTSQWKCLEAAFQQIGGPFFAAEIWLMVEKPRITTLAPSVMKLAPQAISLPETIL
jgi:hypothetical protein